MSTKVRIKRQMTARSGRVKSVELHPSEPWMLTGLYDGSIYIWNTETKNVIKSLAVSDQPVRAARFIPRKNWIITASDDAAIRVYNYNTLEKIVRFVAHRYYIRSIAVHNSRSLVLTAADDAAIKLWDWRQKWKCVQVFHGHVHVVMEVTFNPKDNNQFASASLDQTVKVWQLGSQTPNFSLPHQRQINCVSFHPLGDKPYIASGCDGGVVKVWDYQTKSCVQTLRGHAKDVYAVTFHLSMPLILSCGSDGTVRLWHSGTFQLVHCLNFNLERVWTLACLTGSNSVAVGFDDGAMVIKLGRDEPAISMDQCGRIVWAKHSDLKQANVKATLEPEVKDGEPISLAVKDMVNCEIHPHTVSHSQNGRFVAVCSDGEYIIYTAVALRSKAYGPAQEFVWSHDTSLYAVREGSSEVKLFRNFKEVRSFKPEGGADAIFGGQLLGVRSTAGLTFYDWDSLDLVRRIETKPVQVVWNDSGDMVSLVTATTFYILKYKPDVQDQGTAAEDGREDAFDIVQEVEDRIYSGLWAGDCFIYTNSINRLCYCVGGELVTISHLSRPAYVLAYLPREDRLYLSHKNHVIISFHLPLSVLEYQTAVMRGDFDAADKILPQVPHTQRPRLAHFLEAQGFKSQAMSVTSDPEHKFDLAIHLGDLHTAYKLAKMEASTQKWTQLSDLAMKSAEYGLAQECFTQAKNYTGLLLLATSAGDGDLLNTVAQGAANSSHYNVAFTANFVSGNCDVCLDILLRTDRLPEAALFARSYLPSQVSRVVSLWKTHMSRVSARLADVLADPMKTPNLFPEMSHTEHLLFGQETEMSTMAGKQVKEVLATKFSEASSNVPCSRGVVGKEKEKEKPDEEEEEEEEDGFLKVNLTSINSPNDVSSTNTKNSHRQGLPVCHSGLPDPSQSTQSDQQPPPATTQGTPSTYTLQQLPATNSTPSAVTSASAPICAPNIIPRDIGNDNDNDALLSTSFDEELALEMEGINIEDFDMDAFDFESIGMVDD